MGGIIAPGETSGAGGTCRHLLSISRKGYSAEGSMLFSRHTI
jgi:hypothetical protein